MAASSLAWNERIINRIKTKGLKNTASVAAAGLKDIFFRYILTVKKYIIVERDLSEPIPDITAAVPVTVRKMTPEDIKLIRDSMPGKSAVIKERLASGMPALIALDENGRMMSYYFMAVGKDPNRGVPVKLKKEEGVCVETTTLPEFRGKRIASLLKNEGLKYLKQIGCSRVLGAYAPNYESTRKDLLLNGYRETRALMFINILGLHIRMPWKL